MSVRNLEALLRPGSVALIGASDREGSLGCVVWRNLKGGGFKGPVWPVNKPHDAVGGVPAWRDVGSLPSVPDLAVICTPADTLPGLIAELAAKGTRAAIVMSAGLRKNPVDGAPTLEQAMLSAARPTLLRILGPNCIGALVPAAGLNASFAPGNAAPGELAFVTQSGAVATAMLDWSNGRGIGFSHFISLGDAADVDFGDVLDYLASDSGTRAILLHVESIRDARKFMSAARAAARNKPVIVVKAGRTPDGARATASHTAALAGPDLVFDAAIRRAGMLRVDTLEALFDAAETLARVRPFDGRRLAIVTNGGGAGVLAADALWLGGGQLAKLSPETIAALGRCLPGDGPQRNPVDIIGDAPIPRYLHALRVLLAAPEVDAVLFMHAPTAVVDAGLIASACMPLLQQNSKPVLACWLGAAAVAAARTRCALGGVPCFDTPERAVAAWLQLVAYADNQRALQQTPAAALEDLVPDRAAANRILSDALAQGHEWLEAGAAQAVLEAYGIPTAPGRAAHGENEAAALAPPVRPQARELMLGITSDPLFGPVLLLGEGGSSVESRPAYALALPPLNADLAQDLIRRSRCEPLLKACQSRAAVHEPSLVAALLKLSQMACDLPALAELDIDPLLADASGVSATDARIRLRKPLAGEPGRLAIRPYPHALEERVTLGGQELLLRPIRPGDGGRLKAFYADATPHDMRLRFFMTRREITHAELARYSQIDYDREMTFIALCTAEGGASTMVGEVRGVCDPDNRCAEFALQVAAAWQGKGLGYALLEKLLRYLRERGIAEVAGECLLENQTMAALARALGFAVSTSLPDQITRMRLNLL